MVGFHVPSFAIDGGHLVNDQGAIAGYQILNARTTIFVCEDLLEEQEREIDTFQIDFQRGIGFKCQLVEPYPSTVTFSCLVQGDLAIGLQRHDKAFAQVVLDEHHILGITVPHIAQNVLELNVIVLGSGQQCSIILIFADGRSPFLFAFLFYRCSSPFSRQC